MAREIAFAHHERWDGKGYPRGLSGEHIPLAARIVAVADVYDALSSRRVYKDAIPHDRCVQIIREGAGAQFDPDIVEAWLALQGRFEVIALQHLEETPPVFAPEDLSPAALRHVGGRPTEPPAPSRKNTDQSSAIRA
jgi:putative two-component system response regulator